MDFIKQLIADKGADMLGPLVEKLGFSQEQATGFLPMAVSAIMAKVMGQDKDEGSSFSIAGLLGDGGPDLSAITGMVDTDDLAKKAGVTAEQAKGGIDAIGPSLMEGLKDQGPAALMGALGGGDAGGIMGAVGKLGGLFNK